MAHPVNWFHISAKDSAALADFYKKAFDWKMKPGPEGMAFVEADKGGIPGGIARSMDGKSSATIYVGVTNLEEQLKKIEAAGGKMATPPMDLPPGMGRIAHFVDPEGIFVGLWEGGPAAKKAPTRRAAAKKKATPKKAAPKKAAPKKAPAKKAPAKKKAAPKKAARKLVGQKSGQVKGG